MKKYAVLISIRPEWLAMILSGIKTVEIRKTKPKRTLPIEVYVYCTKSDSHSLFRLLDGSWFCEKCDMGRFDATGKVVAKFTLKAVHEFPKEQVGNTLFRVRGSCLTNKQLVDYSKDKEGNVGPLYAWVISDLTIFDEPKELSEFGLKRPAQSWQYVEEKE